jgi:hypothetical protein
VSGPSGNSGRTCRRDVSLDVGRRPPASGGMAASIPHALFALKFVKICVIRGVLLQPREYPGVSVFNERRTRRRGSPAISSWNPKANLRQSRGSNLSAHASNRSAMGILYPLSFSGLPTAYAALANRGKYPRNCGGSKAPRCSGRGVACFQP